MAMSRDAVHEDITVPDQLAYPSSVAGNGSMHSTPEQRILLKQSSSVGFLCRSLPLYVQEPPIEAVVFGWGVNEDGQLVPGPLTVMHCNLTCNVHSRYRKRRSMQDTLEPCAGRVLMIRRMSWLQRFWKHCWGHVSKGGTS